MHVIHVSGILFVCIVQLMSAWEKINWKTKSSEILTAKDVADKKDQCTWITPSLWIISWTTNGCERIFLPNWKTKCSEILIAKDVAW